MIVFQFSMAAQHKCFNLMYFDRWPSNVLCQTYMKSQILTPGLSYPCLVSSDQEILEYLVGADKAWHSQKEPIGNHIHAPSSFWDKKSGFLFGLDFLCFDGFKMEFYWNKVVICCVRIGTNYSVSYLASSDIVTVTNSPNIVADPGFPVGGARPGLPRQVTFRKFCMSKRKNLDP